MSGRVWTVDYSNEQAIGMIEADLKQAPTVGGRPVVRCGGAGAIWQADAIWKGARLEVTLWPLDPHDIDPTKSVPVLVMPSEGVAR